MASLNKVILIGNAGKDAELRYTPQQTPVATFSLATTERWTKEGQREEHTEWHNIVVWSKLAEIASQYVKKGKQVYVEGRIRTRSWVDPNGVKQYRTEIRADQILLLGQRPQAEAPRDDIGVEPGSVEVGDLGPPIDMDDSPLSPLG